MLQSFFLHPCVDANRSCLVFRMAGGAISRRATGLQTGAGRVVKATRKQRCLPLFASLTKPERPSRAIDVSQTRRVALEIPASHGRGSALPHSSSLERRQRQAVGRRMECVTSRKRGEPDRRGLLAGNGMLTAPGRDVSVSAGSVWACRVCLFLVAVRM